MKKSLALAVMSAISTNYSDFGYREHFPLPNPRNSNAARHKREAKKRANIRARSKK